LLVSAIGYFEEGKQLNALRLIRCFLVVCCMASEPLVTLSGEQARAELCAKRNGSGPIGGPENLTPAIGLKTTNSRLLLRAILQPEGLGCCWPSGAKGDSEQRGTGGYTLVEMVGVLAIISILAGMMIPGVVKRMDRAAYLREASDLVAVSNAVAMQVLRTKVIPAASTWSQTLPAWLDQPQSSITNNARGFARVYLIDTNGLLGTLSLPFTQNSSGISNAVNTARVMIVSSIARALPVASGTLSAASFNDIWNTVQMMKPATWTNWNGTGEELCVQRMNLQPLTHRLILVSRDKPPGRFAIDGSAGPAIPVDGVGWGAYYLDGTVVDLQDTNGVLQARQILKSDASYIFEGGAWRDQLAPIQDPLTPTNSPGTQFAEITRAFLDSPLPSVSHNSATQLGFVNFFYTYMWSYAQWADGNPCFTTGNPGNATQTSNYLLMQEAWADMNSYSNWLLGN
jgi:type II secretory pathway pseudopilin PulG